jgi:LCP family protein required for cell wall assembly
VSGVRKAFIGLGVCMLVLLLGVVGTGFYVQHHLTGQLGRIDNAFTGLTDRPSKPTTGTAASAVNILLMGTDRRSEVHTTGTSAGADEWVPGLQRSDTLMVLHIDGDRHGATVISLPRDSWVYVPGYGMNKINAAFSFAGPSLAVATVEKLTHLRIDHLATIDWEGFKELTDTLGGVTVTVPATVTDSARDVTWTKGVHNLDGEEALTYVRQRYGLPGGDLDRTRRQQYFLRTLMVQSIEDGVLTDPRKIYTFLNTLTRNMSVDSDWSVGDMRGLMLSLRGMQTQDVGFLNAPVAGTGMEAAQSVVYLDTVTNRSLWKAVRDDDVAHWVAANPSYLTPNRVS